MIISNIYYKVSLKPPKQSSAPLISLYFIDHIEVITQEELNELFRGIKVKLYYFVAKFKIQNIFFSDLNAP